MKKINLYTLSTLLLISQPILAKWDLNEAETKIKDVSLSRILCKRQIIR